MRGVAYISHGRFVELHLSARQTHREIRGRSSPKGMCAEIYIARIDDNACEFPSARVASAGRRQRAVPRTCTLSAAKKRDSRCHCK